MRNLDVGRHALCSCVAAVLLGGCGSQPPIGAPGAMPQAVAIAPGRTVAHRGTSSYQVLFRFSRQRRNGAYPDASLIDVNGTLFGTADSGPDRGGIIYSMSTTGEEEVLYSFGVSYGVLSPLVDVNGTLYGTSEYGGAYYNGAVYSITTTGTYTLLYSFKGGSDGAHPRGGLLNVNGTLYGTTATGGHPQCPKYTSTKPLPCGTVYSITTTGKEKVLYAFRNREGWFPLSGLINVKGTLYGTTVRGGTGKCGTFEDQIGCGTVYSVTTTGTHRLLHSFTGNFSGGTDGEDPIAGLTDVNGRLYGATESGGTYQWGTVYSITTAGKEKVIHSFRVDTSDGNTPVSGLVNVHGTLYGMTFRGGTGSRCSYDYGSGCGTVYSVSTTGRENILHSFGVDAGDGALPDSGLTDVNGTLYGTTENGGVGKCRAGQQHIGCGTVFALTP